MGRHQAPEEQSDEWESWIDHAPYPASEDEFDWVPTWVKFLGVTAIVFFGTLGFLIIMLYLLQ